MCEFEIIDFYSRKQAIADGVLIDVTATAKEAGFRWSVALTDAVWETCVAWTDEDTARKGVPQDETRRLWDVVWVASRAAKASRGTNRVAFEIARVLTEGDETAPQAVQLEAIVGPGDDGEPVVTIQLPGED
ncbi:DUF6573 family protein [Plantactinospora sonchi]|uniref:DUF6573 family protein n=1 Tax=Plantactinospora sonchi TaxID=1544735 RepID=A0ABU7RWT5_9ACTN